MNTDITAESLRQVVKEKNKVLIEILNDCKSAAEKGHSATTFREHVGYDGFEQSITDELKRLGFKVEYFEDCKQFVDQYVIVSWGVTE